MTEGRPVKNIIIHVCLLCMLAGACVSSAAYARDDAAAGDGGAESADRHEGREGVERLRFSLGANLWYCWWRPAYSQARVSRFLNLGRINPAVDPALMFGPVLSLEINRSWAVEALFVYAEYSVTVNKAWPLEIPLRPKSESKARRYEAEVTLAHWIYKNMVDFHAGLKYLGHDSRLVYIKGYTFSPKHAGVTAGFSLNFPLVSRLAFVTSLSGIVLAGRERTGVSAAAGGSAAGSFTYSFAASGMTVAIGGRVQYLDYFGRRDPYAYREEDRLYGITISMKYTFE